MNLVKLKMKTIYKFFLVMLGLLILVGALLIYNYYNSNVNPNVSSDIEVYGDLSINYLDEKSFNITGNGEIKLSVTNNSDQIRYYSFNFSRVRGNGSYKIKLNDSVLLEGDLKTSDIISTDYLSIDALESKTYTIMIESENSVKASINIRNSEEKIVTFADLILKNNKVSTATLTNIGLEAAVLNEGLIKSVDDVGVSYYFRGNVENNYVVFADKNWRIVRINGDGTVRLILDGETDSISNYYDANNMSFNFIESNMYNNLKVWFEDNLSPNSELIASSKFCNDISHDESNYYNANTRIMINNIPTLTCLGTTVRSNIGLMSIDEVILAGARTKGDNKSYYLYNESISNVWYTMTAYSGNEAGIKLFMIDPSGNIKTDIDGNLNRGVRPVINLIKNIEMTGNGTKSNPYQLKTSE